MASFATSIAGAAALGEVFPFSRFSMYADIAPRGEGFLPVFLVDGKPAAIERCTGFDGLKPADFAAPEGVASSLDYVVRQRAAWVASHPAGEGGEPNAVVEAGYDIIYLEGGGLTRERRIVARGRARC